MAMMRIRLSCLLIIAFMIVSPTISNADDELFPPAEYIKAKLQQNDIVFLGTRHKQPEILKFIAKLIPKLKELGVTHLGVEVPSDQQEKLDTFMRTGEGLENVKFHPQIDHPDYRSLYHMLRISEGPPPAAVDLPYSKHGGEISRDEWMARSILEVFNEDQKAKMLVILGNIHTIKTMKWEAHVPNKNKRIREYILLNKPFMKMWSVPQLIWKCHYIVPSFIARHV